MIEQIYKLIQGNDKVIEKVLHDENVHYNHMILNNGEGLPVHYSNSTVYMTVLRGILSIALGDQEVAVYPIGTLLKIPYDVKMDVQNKHDEVLELIVVKAPAPKN